MISNKGGKSITNAVLHFGNSPSEFINGYCYLDIICVLSGSFLKPCLNLNFKAWKAFFPNLKQLCVNQTK